MSKRETKLKLPPIDLISITVKDVDAAVEQYSSTFGWGPFSVMPYEHKGTMLRGKPYNCRMKLAFTRLGRIQIELLQVLDGDKPLMDFFWDKGEGLHHVAFFVEDFEGKLATLAKEGIELVVLQRVPIPFAFLDSKKTGGLWVEISDKEKVRRTLGIRVE